MSKLYLLFISLCSSFSYGENLNNMLQQYIYQSLDADTKSIQSRISTSQEKIYKSRLWPQLNLNGNISLQDSSLSLIINQLIYDGGLTGALIKQSTATGQLLKLQSISEMLQQRIEITSAYIDVIAALRAKKLYLQTVIPEYDAFEKYYKRAFKYQSVYLSEPLLAQIENANIQNDYLNIKRASTLKIYELEQILKRKQGSIKTEKLDDILIDQNFEHSFEEQKSLENILKEHPLLKIIAEKQKAIDTQRRAELAPTKPNISLFVVPQYRPQEKEDWRFLTGIKVSIPLFSGFSTKHIKNKFSHEKNLNNVEGKKMALELRTKVLSLIHTLNLSKEKIKLANKHIPTAQRSWNRISTDFKAGTIPSINVVSKALEQLVKLKLKKLEQIVNYNKSHYALKELLNVQSWAHKIP